MRNPFRSRRADDGQAQVPRHSYRDGLQQQYESQVAQKTQRLRDAVELRRAQESDTTKGSHVWFSRAVQNGRFRHWVFVIDDTKYELRRDQASGTYEARTAPWTLEKERREAQLAERHVPELDGYYVYLVGWTRKGPRELKAICDGVMAEFGRYNLVWNNCQDFLRTFADRVIAETALDYSCFRENTKTTYEEIDALHIATPDEIIAAQENARQVSELNIRVAQQQSFNTMHMATRHNHMYYAGGFR